MIKMTAGHLIRIIKLNWKMEQADLHHADLVRQVRDGHRAVVWLLDAAYGHMTDDQWSAFLPLLDDNRLVSALSNVKRRGDRPHAWNTDHRP
jgi:hypothetical protein